MKALTYWPIIVSAYLTLFALGLLDNARAPFFPDIIQDLRLSDTQASLFFVTVSTVAFFSGRAVPQLVNRLGLMNVIRIGALLMGVGFALVSMAQGLLSMVATCVVFGYGFGLLNVAQNLMILKGANLDWRRRLLSGLHGMYAFSSLLAPLLAYYFFQSGVTWRQAFLVFSSFSAVSLVSTFFVKDAATGQAMTQNQKHPQRRVYWLVGSMLSFYILSEILLSTRLTLYVRRVFGYEPEAAALLLSAFFVMLLVGRLFFLIVPLKVRTLKIIEISLIATFICNVMGLWWHPWLLVLCGLTMAPIFALSLDYLTEIFPSYSADAIASCLAISCLYIVSMHFSMGLLTDLAGIEIAMWCGPIFVVASFLLLQFVSKKKPVHLA